MNGIVDDDGKTTDWANMDITSASGVTQRLGTRSNSIRAFAQCELLYRSFYVQLGGKNAIQADIKVSSSIGGAMRLVYERGTVVNRRTRRTTVTYCFSKHGI